MNIKSRLMAEAPAGEAPTGGTGGTPPPDGGAPPSGGAPPAGAWYDSFQDQGVKDWLKSYGEAYPNPEAVATKALNLEKFVGAEKSGRGVIAPKSDAPPEEWQEFYKKVGGVPADPTGYKLPSNLKPEMATALSNDPMVTAFKEHAYKTGMPPMHFESALEWYVNHTTAMEEADVSQLSGAAEKDMNDLKQEWRGVEYDKNVEMGRRAAKEFIPHGTDAELQETLAKMEGAIGTKGLLKLWAKIGGAMGEHGFVGGEGGGGQGGGVSPESARIQIAALKKDSGFAAKLASGDATSRAEWDKLHKIAYPPEQ